MLNSVLQHVEGILNGLTIPLQTLSLDASVQPPPTTSTVGPKAYIYGVSGAWKRQSMPRGQGFQQFDWPVEIVLRLKTSSQVADVDQVFPLFMDAVLWALLTTPMPVMITDPTTAQESQFWSIAESGKVEFPPGRTATDQRALQYDGGISVMVREVIQA